jgi:hypothetical protein
MVENFATFEAQCDDSYKNKIAPVHAVSGGVAPLILNLRGQCSASRPRRSTSDTRGVGWMAPTSRSDTLEIKDESLGAGASSYIQRAP